MRRKTFPSCVSLSWIGLVGISPSSSCIYLYMSPNSKLVAPQVPESFIRESMNSIDIGRGVDIPYRQEALGVILGER